MIRKNKNKEDQPDFEEMMNEVEEDIQEQDAEQDIINRVPELKKLSDNIDTAINTCANARLGLESAIQQYQRAENKLDNAVKTISGKVDTINNRIDQVMEDAPTKLKVSVNVSDAEWQKMHEHHGQWMEQEKQMLADHDKQQETIWQKHSQRLTDIVKNNEGVWISTKRFYVVGSLSLLSIITIVMEITAYLYFHWIQ
jgi:DNA repair exonuclease SbcCD ATPase subunit